MAEALGYSQAADIRKIIKRHEGSLAALGLFATVAISTGGRPATAFYLNKSQALFITTQSGTQAAVEVTVKVIQKFDAYERGLIQAAPVAALPSRKQLAFMVIERCRSHERRAKRVISHLRLRR